MIAIFPLWTFHLYVATFQQHMHMEYIFQSLWFLFGFSLQRVAAYKEGTEPMISIDYA